MGFRLLLWIIAVEALLSFLVFLAVLFWVDPFYSGLVGQLLFYGSTFFLVSGICALTLFWIRARRGTSDSLSENLSVSFREGVLLGILVVSMFVLQSFQVLVWWVGILLGVFFIFLEGMFFTRSSRGNETTKSTK